MLVLNPPTLATLERHFRRLDRRCALTSGLPSYESHNLARRNVLLAIQVFRPLTAREHLIAGLISIDQYLEHLKSGKSHDAAY